jgi:hypothetical protein
MSALSFHGLLGLRPMVVDLCVTNKYSTFILRVIFLKQKKFNVLIFNFYFIKKNDCMILCYDCIIPQHIYAKSKD